MILNNYILYGLKLPQISYGTQTDQECKTNKNKQKTKQASKNQKLLQRKKEYRERTDILIFEITERVY